MIINKRFEEIDKTSVSPELYAKIEKSVMLIRKAEHLSFEYSDKGFVVAFSGGKDSQAILHLAQLARVKFEARLNETSLDPFCVIDFVRKNYPEVTIIPPKDSIYHIAFKKRNLPTRFHRWCCSEYKESSNPGRVTIIGVRRQESSRRANRNEIAYFNKSSLPRDGVQFDEFSEHREQMVSCISGKDKVVLSPILEWSENDVWEFLNKVVKVPHCPLYDQGHSRVGCILCPMETLKKKRQDIKEYPYVKKNWIRTIAKLQEDYISRHKREDKDEPYQLWFDCTPEEIFEYWISGVNFNTWYADNFLQQKIKF